jgi:hypothetical protein
LEVLFPVIDLTTILVLFFLHVESSRRTTGTPFSVLTGKSEMEYRWSYRGFLRWNKLFAAGKIEATCGKWKLWLDTPCRRIAASNGKCR